MLLVALLATLVGGPPIGWTYEQYAVRRDARRFPPPGRFVDVGGRRLHYVCIGSGAPLVLFEVSGFGNSVSFPVARTAVARRTRVCSYDRMGIGWSDPAPDEISAGMLVDDLGRVLTALNGRAPAVLVASSIGGVTAELFARRYPERVAGLVFLDAGNSEAIANLSKRDIPVLSRSACSGIRAVGAISLVRLLDPWHLRNGPTEQAARSAALMYGAKPWRMLCAMVRARQRTLREFAEAPALPRHLPITALSAEKREGLLPPALAAWFQPGDSFVALRATHQRLARGSARGIWRIVPGSDHLIASSQPQAVVEAVFEMVRLNPRR